MCAATRLWWTVLMLSTDPSEIKGVNNAVNISANNGGKCSQVVLRLSVSGWLDHQLCRNQAVVYCVFAYQTH
jgi:hypothetical protein